jgi:hypothetical protein
MAHFRSRFLNRFKSLTGASTRAVDEALRTHNHKM